MSRTRTTSGKKISRSRLKRSATARSTRSTAARASVRQATEKGIVREGISRLSARLRFPKLHVRSLSPILLFTGIILLGYPILKPYLPTGTPSPNSTESVAPSNTGTVQEGFGPIRMDESFREEREPREVPLRIVIPSLGIDLPVVEAKIMNGFWEVSETSASHGAGSAYPGEVGNMVIFAHARKGLFLPLRDIKRREVIYVLTNSGWHRYRVEKTHEVTPEQVEVIQPTEEETLTLFTCTGFADSKRLIVSALP